VTYASIERMTKRPMAILVSAVMIAAAASRAQSTNGSILGTVRDGSGGVLAGALLTLTNTDENVVQSQASAPEGLYQFVDVKPGRYQLTAAKPGFEKAVAPEIVLDARRAVRVDIKMEVAGRTDRVLVQATAPMVHTDDGAIANSRTFEQLIGLPLNYRAQTTSPFSVINTVPGVQVDSLGRYSIAGGLPAQTEFTVDGISNASVTNNGPDTELYPSSEMVSEVQVGSVSFSAAHSQLNDVTVITKSGSNTTHGSLFWYHQNAAMDAATYGSLAKQQKVFHDYGGSLGGAIRLPHLFNGRDRSFFFVDYEGIRKPQTSLQQYSVPAAAMRSGNLTGVPGPAAIDPTTGAPFPGNIIPQSSINPVARVLLSQYTPLPNYDSSVYNYRVLLPYGQNAENFDLRIDHILSARQRLYAVFDQKHLSYLNGQGPLPPTDMLNRYQIFTLSHTFSLASNIVNEFRFGIARHQYDGTSQIVAKDAVSKLGLRGLDLSNVGNGGGFPYIDYSDQTGFSAIGEGRDQHGLSSTLQANDSLTWIKDSHTVQFGIDARRLDSRQTLGGGEADDFGGFVFSSGAFSHSAFADLLLGLPSQVNYAVIGPNLHNFASHYSFFAEDQWKASGRLTLTFGLRWEVHPPMNEASGNMTNFDFVKGAVVIPNRTLPAAGGFQAAINACPGLTATPCTPIVTASQDGLPSTLRRTYYRNWDPRAGLAWRPFRSNRTVLRGGAGIFTQTLLGSLGWELSGVHTSDVRNYSNQLLPGGAPLIQWPQVIPSGLGFIGSESFHDGIDPTLKDPRIVQWSATAENELAAGTLLRVSYIGSHAVGMPVRVDYNQVPASAIPFSTSRVPYPNWNSLVAVENLGFASYEALQAVASRRAKAGLYFEVSYALSHNIGEDSVIGRNLLPGEFNNRVLTDRFNERYDRGDLEGARRHRFLFTAIAPLPFGKGRHFASNWSRFTDAVFGGWDLSTVAVLQTGPYVTPTVAVGLDQSNTNIGGRGSPTLPRPDRIGNGESEHPTHAQYWDRSAFATVPKGAGRFGNAGMGILEGPGTATVATGLAKIFPISERARLRLEGSFTNILNHPNFLPPFTVFGNPNFGVLSTVQPVENGGNRTGQVSARLQF
jgi:hypothetical protein